MTTGDQTEHERLAEDLSWGNLSRPQLERKEEKTMMILGATMGCKVTC